jgi:protein TonB
MRFEGAVARDGEAIGDDRPLSAAKTYDAYVSEVRARITRYPVKPNTKASGTVIVAVKINANGTLVSNRIVESPGHKLLEHAALATVARAAPFPPISAELGVSTVSFRLPFRFTAGVAQAGGREAPGLPPSPWLTPWEPPH